MSRSLSLMLAMVFSIKSIIFSIQILPTIALHRSSILSSTCKHFVLQNQEILIYNEYSPCYKSRQRENALVFRFVI